MCLMAITSPSSVSTTAGFLRIAPKCQNAHLWLVDDRGTKDIAKRPNIGYGVGSAADFVWLQRPRSRAVRKVIHHGSQAVQVVTVRIADHGNDQVALRRGRRQILYVYALSSGRSGHRPHAGVDSGKVP